MTTDQIEKLLRKKAQEDGGNMASAFVHEFEKEAVLGQFDDEEVTTYYVCYDAHEYVKSLPCRVGENCDLVVKMPDNSTVRIDKIYGFYTGEAQEGDVWFGG